MSSLSKLILFKSHYDRVKISLIYSYLNITLLYVHHNYFMVCTYITLLVLPPYLMIIFVPQDIFALIRIFGTLQPFLGKWEGGPGHYLRFTI